MTEITYKTGSIEVSIKIHTNPVTITGVCDQLIKPMLLAYGFHPNNVNEVIDPCAICEELHALQTD